jgi:hypothetical protein
MPHGARLGAVAVLYVGQPWWAYRWGRVLLASAAAGLGAGDADQPGVVANRRGVA